MIKAVLFDFDGVIVESVDIKTKAFERLFKDEGDAVVRKVVDHHLKNCGVSRFEKFKYIYQKILNRELSEQKFKKLCDSFSELVIEEVIKAPYVKGAKEFLDNFSPHYRCFVVSGTPQDEIEKIVKDRKMSGYFVKVYGAPRKKRDIVNAILNDYKLSKDEAVFVGDSLSDYEGAVSNGVAFIARINDNEALFSDKKCIKIKNLKELQAQILRL